MQDENECKIAQVASTLFVARLFSCMRGRWCCPLLKLMLSPCAEHKVCVCVEEREAERTRSEDVDEAENEFKTTGKFQMNANISNMMRDAERIFVSLYFDTLC